MKICILLLINLMCFLSCSKQAGGSDTSVSKNPIVSTTNEDSRSDPAGNQVADADKTPNVDIVDRRKLGNLRIDAYEDGKLVTRRFFYKGQLKKEISYNSESNSAEFVTEYFYTENGDFERLTVTKGDDSVLNDIFSRSARDLKFQSKLLKSKGIEFPLPDIVSDAVGDLSRIFSIADNYSDFKTETRLDGNQKVIKFIGFNKRIGYERASMTFRSGGLPILVNDYQLRLEMNFPTEESITTDEGKLTKMYSYKDGKLIGVVYKFTDLENRTNSLEKRFEYHELR